MSPDETGNKIRADALAPWPSVDFETLVRLSGEAVMQLSPDGSLVYASPAVERLLGWPVYKLPEMLSDVVYFGPPNPEAEALHKVLSGRSDPAASLPGAEVQLRSAFGPLIWAEATIHQLADEAGHARGHVVFLRNIARRKELEGLLEAATQTDPLTGLYNRRAFEDSLHREWAVALREKTHTTLIKVSLDRFDALADRYGAGAADACLTKVAKTLHDTARRPADVAARTAASEFALLLPRTHELGAETISAYLRVAIEDLGIPNPDNPGGDGMITASVGAACAVAEQNGVSESSEFLLAAAETCLFQARQEGGNRVKTVMNVLGQ